MGSSLFRQDLENIKMFCPMIRQVYLDKISYARHENVILCEDLYFDEDIKDECFDILNQIRSNNNSIIYAEIDYYDSMIYAIKLNFLTQVHSSNKIISTTYGWSLNNKESI